MATDNIAVIGGGTMGNGIAAVFALNGFNTVLAEQSTELCERAVSAINLSLGRMLKKGLINSSQHQAALEKLTTVVGIAALNPDTHLVVEAVYEDKEVKKNIFRQLNEIINPECIFASNTSSISITELAAVSRPERFIGMHFMNPVPVMKLVEIIRGYSTSDQTAAEIIALCGRIGKTPVEVNDFPGFVANRILMPMINEAVNALMEGVASREAIDTVMTLGMNHPMGPLTLADFIGLDVCLAIMNVLYDGFKDPRYRPSPLLVKMVNAGKLGRKTREGFFKYE